MAGRQPTGEYFALFLSAWSDIDDHDRSKTIVKVFHLNFFIWKILYSLNHETRYTILLLAG